MRGRFISFEGGEGVGKSTQVSLLCDVLHARAIPYIKTREPGGTPNALAVRELLVQGAHDRWDRDCELFLFLAARIDHWRKKILPALLAGQWVVCDRFSDSTVAYQAYGYQQDLYDILELHQKFLPDARPDCTIILDTDLKISLSRARARSIDQRFERKEMEFHERVRNGFRHIAKQEPKRCKLVDASCALHAVHAAILTHVEALIP
ncbi:MAG: dTMP kinase [Pseudomonadota bacterium]